MQKNLKKLTLAFVVTSIFSIGIYYIVNLYDKSGTTMLWIETNIQYLMFLYISIITSLTLYSNEDKNSKLILASVILINFLYIIFSFGVSNIGLNNTQGLFLIGFLIIALISNYIKNRFGYIITTLSLVGIVSIILLAIIPLYEVGPDITGFKNQFSTKIITYSKISIKSAKASIQIDKKEYSFGNGLSSYDFKINKSGSQILFKSDKKNLNTFGYLLFPNKEIIQMYPQSAMNIKKLDNKYQIEIIAGTIKHNISTGQTDNISFYFTGDLLSYGIMNNYDKKQITDFYDKQLKEYIQNQIGGELSSNKNILYISENIITFLSKVMPSQFNDNIDNFNRFQLYIEPDTKTNLIKFDNNNIKNSILNNISDSLETTKIIK